ncbi:MAG: hypothetical protein ACI4EV_08230 [Lachnospiraceae bacterium]
MDIVKVSNEGYSRYEELLLKRDKLKKQAFEYEMAYTRELGDLITKVFEQKVECIRKKKIISFCQARINQGKDIKQAQLQSYIDVQMKEYNEHLKQMAEENEAAKNAVKITNEDVLQIKKIYRRLAKLIHPDINPKTAQTPSLMELWNKTVIDYNCNNLKGLQEDETLVKKALEGMNMGVIEVEIPDIEKRIEEILSEIDKITHTNPYMYKYLLDDNEAIDDVRKDLQDELKSYAEYGKELDKVIEEMLKDGVKIIWQMK